MQKGVSCRSEFQAIDVEKLKCDVTVRQLMDNTTLGVTELPTSVGSLVEKFESLMTKKSEKSKNKFKSKSKISKNVNAAKNKILSNNVPEKSQKLNKKDLDPKRIYKNELTPDSSSDEDDSTDESESGSSESDTSESGSSGSDSSSFESDSSDVEHSTMTSEEEDTDFNAKHREKTFKIGNKVIVFPAKDSYRTKDVTGTIRQITKLGKNKLFGVHLQDSTSRGLGEKINVKNLDKKCQQWYTKGTSNRIWIRADRICKPSLLKDFKK